MANTNTASKATVNSRILQMLQMIPSSKIEKEKENIFQLSDREKEILQLLS